MNFFLTWVSMAEKNLEDTVVALPWPPCDDKESHHRHYHSHCLQAHLSEVEEKIKAMVSIIEEDGDSFAERAETFYRRRPELLNLLHHLLRSYRFLAAKYRHPETLNHFVPSTSSSSSKHSLISRTLALTDSSSCAADFEGTALHFSRYMKRAFAATELPHRSAYTPRTALSLEKATKRDIDGDRDTDRSKSIGLTGEQYVSELVDAHLLLQAELAKGNEEKRAKIKELRWQVKKLTAENEALKKTGDAEAKGDAGKPKGTLFAKLTGCTF